MSRFASLREPLAGFAPIKKALLIFTGVNILVFILTSLYAPLSDALALSAQQPWGVATSIFVHAGPVHLLVNLVGFTIWSLMFVVMHLLDTEGQRFSASKFFLSSVFAAGVVTNAIELVIWVSTGSANTSIGASGMVYAALGLAFASAFLHFSKNVSRFGRKLAKISVKKVKHEGINWQALKVSTVGALTPGLLFGGTALIILAPSDFFSAGPGIDVFGHEMGFLFGFSFAIIKFFMKKD